MYRGSNDGCEIQLKGQEGNETIGGAGPQDCAWGGVCVSVRECVRCVRCVRVRARNGLRCCEAAREGGRKAATAG